MSRKKKTYQNGAYYVDTRPDKSRQIRLLERKVACTSREDCPFTDCKGELMLKRGGDKHAIGHCGFYRVKGSEEKYAPIYKKAAIITAEIMEGRRRRGEIR